MVESYFFAFRGKNKLFEIIQYREQILIIVKNLSKSHIDEFVLSSRPNEEFSNLLLLNELFMDRY